jgi:hypothetical protein
MADAGLLLAQPALRSQMLEERMDALGPFMFSLEDG